MKKSATVTLIAVLAAVAAGIAWWTLGARPAGGDAQVAGAPPAAASGAASSASGAAGGGGPVSVTTLKAERRDMVVSLDANGTVAPLNQVDVRPQVSSVIAKVHVKEGQFVKAGELLFTLDARADEANVAKAAAQLQKDEAALADAQRQFARSQDLFRQNFVSQSAVDTSRTGVETQQAVVATSRAAVTAAKVALGYGRIVAPSAGRVGAINVYAGSYVQPATSLVTITQLDPIAVAFSVPQRNLDDVLAGLRSGQAPVSVQLPEGKQPIVGKLQFVDSAVDASSGNVKVKAQFGNGESRLWPGAYVNVRLALRTLKDAVVVPQAAVIQSPRGTIVYTVENGKAAPKRIEVVYASGPDAAVTGLQGGERIVLEGRQNLRPGVPVVERAPGPAGAASGARGKRGGDAATSPGSAASAASAVAVANAASTGAP